MKRVFSILFFLILSAGPAFAILPGPIKDFYTPRPGDTTAIVFGTRGVPADWIKKLERLAYRNADYLKQKDPARAVEVYADTVFSKELFARRSLVLMGTPRSNPFLGEWRSFFPFMLRDGRFNIGGRKLYSGEDVTLSCIFPNPLAEDRYALLLVGNEPWAQPSLSDWPGDYDYYVAQRHTFWGQHLNRGKFAKTSGLWSQELSEYDRAPGDTVDIIGFVYPYGKVWYPFHWEENSFWGDDPLPERIRLLTGVQNVIHSLESALGMRVYGSIDLQLSERYPEAFAYDPMGRVFVRTHPKQMDSLAFLSWGKPLIKVLIPCRDAPLDWELFGHRYLLTQAFLRFGVKISGEGGAVNSGRKWAMDLSSADSTYFMLLTQLVLRGQAQKIGEALDSVTQEGEKHSFQMSEFSGIVGRIVKDTFIQRLARMPLRPSPYGRKPAYELGIKNLGELFLNSEVVVAELAPKSRALAAGLRKGDKIISVDGLPTARNRSRAYLAWLGKKKGETLKLVIERRGVKRTLAIPLG